MKNLFIILIVFLFLSCASVSEKAEKSDFWKHDSMYLNWSHLKFSWGLTEPTNELHRQSTAEGWWGLEVEVSE